MKKQTLPLFFTLLLSLLFLSACVPDLKINFKKEPTTSTSKKKTFKKMNIPVAISGMIWYTAYRGLLYGFLALRKALPL